MRSTTGLALMLVITLVIGLAVSACTKSPQDMLAEARELQSQGRIEESIPVLRGLIDSGNRDGEAMYRYGRALSLTGQPGRGIWALDAALKDPEWFVRSSHQIAMDAYRAKNLDLTLETLERLRDERDDDHSQDLEALLLELRVRIETRVQYEDALELAETILDDYPDEERAIRLKAAALIGLKQTDEAYELIREAGLLASGSGDLLPEERPEAGDDDEEETQSPLDLAEGSSEREAYWCTVRATFKREADEPEDAARILDRCLEQFPSNVGLLNEAVKLFAQIDRYDRVLEILRNANEDQPDHRELRLSLVAYLTRIGDAPSAEAVLRKALDAGIERSKEDGGRSQLVVAKRWVDLAGFLVDQERKDEALDAYDEALAILGEQASPAFLFRHADALVQAGRYDDALAIADRTPIEVHAPMIRGRVAFERGEYEKAIEELDKAALLWPDNAPVRYYLARSAEGIGDFDRATEEYRHAMRSDPNLSAARERLARLHLAEGRVRHASTILAYTSPREASEPSPEMKLLDIEVQSRLGLDAHLGIKPSAGYPLEVLRRRAVQSVARGLRSQSDALSAQRVLAELEVDVAPEVKGAFLRERVALLIAAGNVDAAIRLAKARAERTPKDLEIAAALGQALVAKDAGLSEAEGILKVVLEAWPNDLGVLIALGDLARQQGATETAANYYERALVVSPESWEALSPLLDGMFENGRSEEAMKRLRTYLEVGNPYEGRAALELAQRLAPGDAAEISQATKEEQIELTHRALRFGAGLEALDLLTQLDPEAAKEYSVLGPVASVPTGDDATAAEDEGEAKQTPMDESGDSSGGAVEKKAGTTS